MASPFLTCQPPEEFDFSKSEDWPRWIRRFERFRMVSGLQAKTSIEQVNALIYTMGDKAEDVLLSLSLTEEQMTQYDVVRKAFEDHFIVRRNLIYDRSKFHSRIQEDGEPVEQFVTDLHALAKYCKFGTLHDEMIRDRIVVGVRDYKLSEKMQLDANLTLETATTMARQSETIKGQQAELRPTDSVSRVKAIRPSKDPPPHKRARGGNGQIRDIDQPG
ncbi:uncharacterized protein ISCGN_025414 [Ixodes scapularis]